MRLISKVLLATVALFVLTATVAKFLPVQAQSPSDYTFSHSKRNIYSDEILIYNFSGLEPTQEYTLTAQELNLLGNVVGTLGSVSFSNLTSTQFIFPFDFNETDSWKVGFYPFRTIDNFGHVLGSHFMAPEVPIEWLLDTATTSGNAKQGISLTPYAPENSDGYHRTTEALFATTTLGDIALLHYTATSTIGNTDVIRINDIQNLTTTVTLSLSEMMGYNQHDSFPDATASTGYVVLNSDGHFIPYVDYVESANEFLGTYDNPFYIDIASGVYDYPRYTAGGVLISYGQNVWVLSENAGPLLIFGGTEWDMVAQNNSVVQGGNQVALFLQFTENVWNDYPLQQLTDSNLGTIDDTDYAYARNRSFPFTVSNTLGTATLTWIVQAVGMSVPSIDPYLFRFEITDTYVITSGTAVGQTGERVGDTLDLLALKSPLGQVVAMLGLMLLLMGIAYVKVTKQLDEPLRNLVNFMIFLGVGGLFIYTGYASVVTITVWGVGAVYLSYTLVRSRANA